MLGFLARKSGFGYHALQLPPLFVAFIWNGMLEDSADDEHALKYLRQSKRTSHSQLTFAREASTVSDTDLSFKILSQTSLKTETTSNRVPRHEANKICSVDQYRHKEGQQFIPDLSSDVHLQSFQLLLGYIALQLRLFQLQHNTLNTDGTSDDAQHVLCKRAFLL